MNSMEPPLWTDEQKFCDFSSIITDDTIGQLFPHLVQTLVFAPGAVDAESFELLYSPQVLDLRCTPILDFVKNATHILASDAFAYTKTVNPQLLRDAMRLLLLILHGHRGFFVQEKPLVIENEQPPLPPPKFENGVPTGTYTFYSNDNTPKKQKQPIIWFDPSTREYMIGGVSLVDLPPMLVPPFTLCLPFDSPFSPFDVVAHAYTLLLNISTSLSDSSYSMTRIFEPYLNYIGIMFRHCCFQSTVPFEDIAPLLFLPFDRYTQSIPWYGTAHTRLFDEWVKSRLTTYSDYEAGARAHPDKSLRDFVWNILFEVVRAYFPEGSVQAPSPRQSLLNHLHYMRRLSLQEAILSPIPNDYLQLPCIYASVMERRMQQNTPLIAENLWFEKDRSLILLRIEGGDKSYLIYDWMAAIRWSYIIPLFQAGLSEARNRVIELPRAFPAPVLKTLVDLLHMNFTTNVAWRLSDEEYAFYVDNCVLYRLREIVWIAVCYDQQLPQGTPLHK